MKLTRDEQILVAEAKALARRVRPEEADKPGACMVLSAALVEAASRRGRKLLLQAGSSSWRRLLDSEDDGVVSTHFSYQWSPDDPESRLAIQSGFLAEVHVWVVDPVTRELFDLTAPNQPLMCEKLQNMTWTAPRPTDVKFTADELRAADSFYEPDLQAILYILSILRRIWRSHDFTKP